MTQQEILDYFSLCEAPMLDNGYYYHADQEIKIYRNESDWLMVLQVIRYNKHCLDLNGFTTNVYKYGSRIPLDQVFTNNSFYFLASDVDIPNFIEEPHTFNSYLNPLVEHLRVRNQTIKIDHDVAYYASKRIDLESSDEIRPFELLRCITPEYSHLFWITRDELGIDKNLKEDITLSKWEHPDGFNTGLSDMPGFKEIAKCLSENSAFDRSKIETPSSNTHWSNWPMGGML